MKNRLSTLFSFIPLAGIILPLAAQSQIVITEVDAAGSGNANYGADWFEIRNTGASAIDLTGWKMDDSSAAFASAVALRGIGNLAPGQFAVLLEGNTTGTTDGTINSNFVATWFGGTAPSALIIANYGGSGVGLSTTAGDGVNLFDSGGALQASVSFGVTPIGATLDNAAGLSGTISQAGVVGVNGAFTSFVTSPASEIGSPGVVPEPSMMAVSLLGFAALALKSRPQARR
jgi:hypothetical protein